MVVADHFWDCGAAMHGSEVQDDVAQMTFYGDIGQREFHEGDRNVNQSHPFFERFEIGKSEFEIATHCIQDLIQVHSYVRCPM